MKVKPATLFVGLLCLSAGSMSCHRVFDYAIDRTLGSRSPIGIRINFTRQGTPISEEGFQKIEEGKSDLAEAFAAIGAPTKMRRTPTEEILEYHYFYDRQTRFVVRPLFFYPYGGSITYNQYGFEKGIDVVTLVFDHQGLLKRKEFRKSAPLRTMGATAKEVFVP